MDKIIELIKKNWTIIVAIIIIIYLLTRIKVP